jgi:hypothetical protein
MLLKNKKFELKLSDFDGAVVSLRGKKEYAAKKCPLFTVALIDEKGVQSLIHSDSNMMVEKSDGGEIVLTYSFCGGKLTAVARVVFGSEGELLWRFGAKNNTGLRIDYILYPNLTVPDDLIGDGGKARLFWPAMEGTLIEESGIRDNTFTRHYSPGYPSKGWEGVYPGACSMQFFAYYDDSEVLYYAAHDDAFNVKIFEWSKAEGGITLEMGLYPGVGALPDIDYTYDIVMDVMPGDWYDAAEKYRGFLKGTRILDMPRYEDNKDIPAWAKESPIVAVYPVRGVKDTGDMSPNMYYPYTNGLKYVDGLNESLDSKVMALLCHWEGSAPWAPPFVWPPYGDKQNFDDFARGLHKKGNLFGLYCSGMGWTEKSSVCPEYNMEEYFIEHNLKDAAALAPDGSLPYSLICGGPIRTGYDLCPGAEQTKEIVLKEIEKILVNSEADYIQFFDQNIGGGVYKCYAGNHGHPPVPGKWQSDVMRELSERINALIERCGKKDKVLIGCEEGAAEHVLDGFRFNDLRYNINYMYGNPVPAYNFVFHEYVNNFMGNQNTSYHTVDFEKYPDNIFYRFAYSFAQGDVLTVVLKNDGKIHWDWCTPWDIAEVEQKGISEFIKLLNSFRKNLLFNELHYGKMEKPYRVECGRYIEKLKYGGSHLFSSVVSTRFTYRGADTQLLVNYLSERQTVTVFTGGKRAEVIRDVVGSAAKEAAVENGRIQLELEPRSVAVLKILA